MLLSAIGFGIPGSLSRIASDDGMGPFAFLTWRAGIGSAVIGALLVVLLVNGRVRWPSGHEVSRRDRSALLTLLIFNAVVNVAMFLAFTRTTIGVAMICFYTYPALVALGAARLFGEPIDRRRGVALSMGFGGLILVLAPSMTVGGAIDPLGVALALAASALQAVNVLLTGRGFGGVPIVITGLLMNLVPVLIYVVLAVAVGEAPMPFGVSTDRVAAIVVFSGVLGAAMPTLANLAGIGIIGPARTAILMLFEAVVAATAAALLLAERPAPIQIVGGVGVLLSVALLQAPERDKPLTVEPVHPTI